MMFIDIHNQKKNKSLQIWVGGVGGGGWGMRAKMWGVV